MNTDTPYSYRILVVKNRAIGDSLIGLASVAYIKSVLPGATVDYAIPSFITPLYENLSAQFDHLAGLKTNTLSDFIRLGRQLWGHYDVIIELSQAGRTGLFFRIFSALSRTRYYFHNHHKKMGTFILDQGVTKPIIQRDLDGVYSALKHFLGKDLRVPSFLDFTPRVSFKMSSQQRHSKKIVLGLVATREEKCWPAIHYRDLCRLLIKHDQSIEFLIPLSSSMADQKLRKEVQNLSFPNTKIIEVPLAHLPGAISEAGLYIGNDTGLKHLCAALDMRTFTLFGPENPLEWHPYDHKKHPFIFVKDAGFNALKEMSPQFVFDRLLHEKF
jgi:heptosyltransferase-2